MALLEILIEADPSSSGTAFERAASLIFLFLDRWTAKVRNMAQEG